MHFSPDLRERVASGEVTVSFRLWRNARVKVGGRYPVLDRTFVVDAVELMPFAAISDEDVRLSGEADREALRRRAAHAGPVDDDTLLHRVELHVEP